MNVSDLKGAILQAHTLLSAAGSSASAADLARLNGLLDRYEDRDAKEAIEDLAADVLRVMSEDSELKKAAKVQAHIGRLKDAGAEFEKAKGIVAEIDKDKSMTKTEIEQIAFAYSGVDLKLKTRTQGIAALTAKAFDIARSTSQEKHLRSMSPW